MAASEKQRKPRPTCRRHPGQFLMGGKFRGFCYECVLEIMDGVGKMSEAKKNQWLQSQKR